MESFPAADPLGSEDLLAGAVIDASGTWQTPNMRGASGLPAAGEREAADRIAHALPDVAGADPNPRSFGTVPPHGVDELAHPEAGRPAPGAGCCGG